MDWHHTITPEVGDRHRVTFAVTIRGPGSLPTALIARSILEQELPATVDKLIATAEAETTGSCSS